MEHNDAFLDTWDYFMKTGAYLFVAIGILVFLYHKVRVTFLKDLKDRYDYVNLYEIRYAWYAIIAFITAIAFFINSIGTDQITSRGMLWFYVRIFITVSFTIIFYFIFFSMVKIYYPRYVEKRLQKLRTTPRISPDGNVMRRLSEAEEDAHLDASQIAEEASNVHSIDYDVWIDEKTGYKKIEKYLNYLHAEKCPECGYFTFKITREEVEVAPTEYEAGKLLRHYKCSYCNHREMKEVGLSKLSDNVS